MQWHETVQIVSALEENNNDIDDIEGLDIIDLRDLIIELDEFSDDPNNVSKSDLKAIKQHWIEYRTEN